MSPLNLDAREVIETMLDGTAAFGGYLALNDDDGSILAVVMSWADRRCLRVRAMPPKTVDVLGGDLCIQTIHVLTTSGSLLVGISTVIADGIPWVHDRATDQQRLARENGQSPNVSARG